MNRTVITMYGMFNGVKVFNTDISSWKTNSLNETQVRRLMHCLLLMSYVLAISTKTQLSFHHNFSGCFMMLPSLIVTFLTGICQVLQTW